MRLLLTARDEHFSSSNGIPLTCTTTTRLATLSLDRCQHLHVDFQNESDATSHLCRGERGVQAAEEVATASKRRDKPNARFSVQSFQPSRSVVSTHATMAA